MASPDDSPLSREKLREILIEAAPALPPLGDVSNSRTAAGTTVHPGDVIQQPPQLSESQPPTLSDF